MLVRLPPRVVIAAPQGRSGKTTVSIAIGRALHKRGIRVQPFKKGPDYIDPSWLAAACGVPCYNLDAYLMGDDTVMRSFARRSAGRGYRPDGRGHGPVRRARRGDGRERGCPGADARCACHPRRQRFAYDRSVAAMVGGYQHFEPGTRIAGVILNHVSGPRHEEKLKEP